MMTLSREDFAILARKVQNLEHVVAELERDRRELQELVTQQHVLISKAAKTVQIAGHGALLAHTSEAPTNGHHAPTPNHRPAAEEPSRIRPTVNPLTKAQDFIRSFVRVNGRLPTRMLITTCAREVACSEETAHSALQILLDVGTLRHDRDPRRPSQIVWVPASASAANTS